MIRLLKFSAITIALFFSGVNAWAMPIYGEDDRLDLYKIQDQKLLKLADSTVALVESKEIEFNKKTGHVRLKMPQYGKRMKFCPGERFSNQPSGVSCTGALVGPDLVLTAGHCMANNECPTTKIMFGLSIREKGQYPEIVPGSELYSCAQIVSRKKDDLAIADWALIRLDRKVRNHSPLGVNRSGKINKGTPLLVIGHPGGLPQKIAGGAWVRNILPEGNFETNLDTFEHNSGSPVFNAATGLIEGVVSFGEDDYTFSPKEGCYRSKQCPDSGCDGEVITKASAFARQIPPLPGF